MKNKEKNFISAVIYVHNAEERIVEFLKMIISMMEENFEHSEIICVNDSSTDNSLSLIKEASTMAKITSVSVVNMSYFHGLEVAMNAGVDLAIGDFVFEFDSTVLDYPQDEIMNVYRRSLQGYDIVSAASDQKDRSLSKLFYYIFNKFTDVSYKMRTESFRILSRRAINRVISMNKTVPYRKAVYVEAGFKMDTIIYTSRGGKNSLFIDKVEKMYRLELAVDALLLFTQIGYRFSIVMTALMMLLSVFMMVYSAAIYVKAHPIDGWTTTILFLSVAFLGLFGILTIIIKYLQLLLKLVFKRKQYSFESIEKLTK